MNYIGSKNKLTDFIINSIEENVGGFSNKVYAEIFGGTGIVARKLKTKVKKIIASDFEFYSFVLLRNYIGNHKQIDASSLFQNLNSLKGVEGFIYKNYCKGGHGERNYFSDENGKKIDAVRIEIEKLKKAKKISKDLYFHLLASLIESADKVANTASVYGAYLKKIKKTALKTLELKPAIYETNENSHDVFMEDSNTLISKIEGDILYLDPPYNHRQYGANYHLLNTIALYDNFIPSGITGLRDYNRSKYCTKKDVAQEFEDLIKKAKFKHIFLSYNNEGLLPFDYIKKTMSKYGKYNVAESKNYQRFKADRDENRTYIAEKTTEYLHILEKN
ncbi:MAG: DNA adenine methylase [Melioribacteraceae bacterium]